MPATEQDAEAQAQAQMDETAATRGEQIDSLAPQAREPLEPAAVNSLGEITVDAIGTMTGGQGPEVSVAPVSEPQDRLPSDVWRLVSTLAAFFEGGGLAEAEPYKFSPIELGTTNDGLNQMQGIVSGAAKDAKLAKALRRPITAGAPPSPPKGKPPEKGMKEKAAAMMEEEV